MDRLVDTLERKDMKLPLVGCTHAHTRCLSKPFANNNGSSTVRSVDGSSVSEMEYRSPGRDNARRLGRSYFIFQQTLHSPGHFEESSDMIRLVVGLVFGNGGWCMRANGSTTPTPLYS
ncbi:hypothetical protein CBL_07254 [Carabus blaptoides fortunei]